MYNCVGFRKVDYVNKDNNRVKGYEFHLVELDKSTVDEGYGVLTIFLKLDNVSGTVCVGAPCDLCYSVVRGNPRITGIKF